ncbi:MAG: competence protein ComFB [SAR324 cluster bacterium]|uniref:Competence protein ComFB n=1 Tax=SAR324 cluster bacterium TaxID=2024889 RepID=A0A2A4T8G2_9DELT|nr:MAG: competence protein ComFB [SAR324 cluster bacterium]
MQNEKYVVNGYNLEHIRNLNEERVIQAMRALLHKVQGFDGCQLCTEDVYALSAKQLPPQYVQVGSIVLKKNVTDEDVYAIVKKSAQQVVDRPNHD